jgi:hypothetical protein
MFRYQPVVYIPYSVDILMELLLVIWKYKSSTNFFFDDGETAKVGPLCEHILEGLTPNPCNALLPLDSVKSSFCKGCGPEELFAPIEILRLDGYATKVKAFTT